MSGSFDFEDHGGGAARETPSGRSAGTVDWFDAVGVLGNL